MSGLVAIANSLLRSWFEFRELPLRMAYSYRQTPTQIASGVLSLYNQCMSFSQVAIQDYPVGLWTLDDYPFVNEAGFSTATAFPTTPLTNIFSNPSAETNVDFTSASSRVTVSRGTAWSSSGTASFRCVRTADANTDAWLELDTAGLISSGRLKVNSTYTIMGTVRQNTLMAGIAAGDSTNTSQRKSIFVHLNGTQRATVNGTNTVGTQTLRVTFTTPSTFAGYNSIRFYCGGAPGDVFDWDSMLLVEGNYTGPYFDGDSAGAGWTGTPHASTSVTGSALGWHAALVKGAQGATIVNNTNRLSFTAPVMRKNQEDQDFTIEVTVRPLRKEVSSAQQQIFGTSSAMDGIVLAGTMLSFATKYTTTGSAKCEYNLQELRAFTVAAVHTKKKNSLYVNGDLVAEVDITEAQQADTYLATGTSLSSGTSSSTSALALNGLAIYQRALDESDIDQHYEEATDNMDEYAVGAAHGGAVFALNSATSTPIAEYNYTLDEHWQMGRMSGTVIEYGQIVPQKINNISQAGFWEAVVQLPPATTLSSVTLDWRGQGETVQTSTDGTQWFTEKRAARISTVNDGFSTANKVLFVRVTFPGGIQNDTAYFDELTVNLYGPTPAPSLETRTLTLTGASIESDFDITEYHENWGVELVNGSLSLSGASQSAMTPKTIQIWARKSSTDSFTDNMAATATNSYTNNASALQAYQLDEWQLRTYTFTSGHGIPITITGTGQIGCILIYPYVMTAAQVSESYLSFTGTRKIQFSTSGTIGFVDISNTVDIYEYNWSIESAG